MTRRYPLVYAERGFPVKWPDDEDRGVESSSFENLLAFDTLLHASDEELRTSLIHGENAATAALTFGSVQLLSNETNVNGGRATAAVVI